MSIDVQHGHNKDYFVDRDGDPLDFHELTCCCCVSSFVKLESKLRNDIRFPIRYTIRSSLAVADLPSFFCNNLIISLLWVLCCSCGLGSEKDSMTQIIPDIVSVFLCRTRRGIVVIIVSIFFCDEVTNNVADSFIILHHII